MSQFNEGLSYLQQTTDQLKLGDSKVLTEFVVKESRKRKMHQNAKKKWSFKRRRKQLKKTRAKVKDQNERKEGATYETGIGVTEEGTALSKGVLNETMSSFAKDDLEKIEALVTQTTPETVVTPSEDNQTDEVYECFAFDLETTGLKRDSEILQIACASCENSENRFCQYSVPDGNISSSASKVNGLSLTLIGQELTSDDNMGRMKFPFNPSGVEKPCCHRKLLILSNQSESFEIQSQVSYYRYSIDIQALRVTLRYKKNLNQISLSFVENLPFDLSDVDSNAIYS